MLVFKVLLVFVVLMNFSESKDEVVKKKLGLYGGECSPPGKYSFGVRVRAFKTPTGFIECSGSLINCRTVITSGICGRETRNGMIVYAGNLDPTVSDSNRVKVNAKYWVNHCTENVAILFLNKSISESNLISYASLTSSDTSYVKNGAKLTMIGIGMKSSVGDGCQRYAETTVDSFTDSIITVKSALGASACQGDWGGALVKGTEKVLIGAENTTHGYCDVGPAVDYIRLAPLNGWIKNTISNAFVAMEIDPTKC